MLGHARGRRLDYSRRLSSLTMLASFRWKTGRNLSLSRLETDPTTLRQHRGSLDTLADIRRLENGQFILLPMMEHLAAVESHGNRFALRSPNVIALPRHWRPPSTVSSLLFAVGFKDLRGCKRAGRCQRCRRKNGGRTTEERQKNGISNLAVKP